MVSSGAPMPSVGGPIADEHRPKSELYSESKCDRFPEVE